jgi:hypothetical protein
MVLMLVRKHDLLPLLLVEEFGLLLREVFVCHLVLQCRPQVVQLDTAHGLAVFIRDTDLPLELGLFHS